MNTELVTGWLFDLYPSRSGITIWLVDREGRKRCILSPYTPSFFMHIGEHELGKAKRVITTVHSPVTFERTARKDIYRNEELDVFRVSVSDPLQLKSVVRKLERHFPHFVFYNSDIMPQQLFLYETGLFPLAFGEYHVQGNTLTGWQLADRYDATEYSFPPLTSMKLANAPDFVAPKFRKQYQLEISYDGQTYSLEHERPADVLHALNRHLRRCDPDILLTEYGDAILLPMLAGFSADLKIPLLLNRDSSAGYFTTKESSYFVYGKIVHKDGAFELAGRWHLDVENSFMMSEANLDGIVEIARLTQLPVQHQSRSTIGTALSSMQLSWAFRNGYLIPAKKREPEDFKSASTLLLADRGGLIFQPEMGYHAQIAELDFVSMYPSIMVEHNVSPETVNCRCCSNAVVPELEYSICERRAGIVPSTLRPVVERRSFYKKEKKRLKKAGNAQWHVYDHRQNALKWILVTCFGYLGYKNARFGKIEAHESVNAFSREKILQAKEIAELQGYRFIHAIVDCMWLYKEGATESDYERLCADVRSETRIEISLEGIYKWILFPSSKMDPHIPTANRYVGFYENDEVKVRGIELRRRDTPKFIKRIQAEMLDIFQSAANPAEVGQFVPQALAKAKEHIEVLRSGKADPLELVIRRHISQEAGEYKNRSANAEVARTLEEAGIKLQPGEMVEYVLLDASGKKKPEKAKPLSLYALDDGYDIEKYTEMALKAVETLLLPFGYDVPRLKHEMGIQEKKRERTPAAKPKNSRQMTMF